MIIYRNRCVITIYVVYGRFDKFAQFNRVFETERLFRVLIDSARFYFEITRTGNPAGNSGHFSRRRAVIPTGSRVSASYLSRSFPILKRRNQLRVSRRICTFIYIRETILEIFDI